MNLNARDIAAFIVASVASAIVVAWLRRNVPAAQRLLD